MGYDIHITRKENWFDEDGLEISLPEWLAYVSSDSEIRLDGYAEATTGGGAVVRVTDPSMAVWVAHPDHGERNGMAWLWLSGGNIVAKNPNKEILSKMYHISQIFGGKVQGDDGELYDCNGAQKINPLHKPWWRIW